MIRSEGGNQTQFGWYGFQLGVQTATTSRREPQQIILANLLELF
jgi:hypothetical protein